jgi:hypothetical protein
MSGAFHYGPGDLSVIRSNGAVTLANARGLRLQAQNPLVGYRPTDEEMNAGSESTSTQHPSSIPSQTAAAECVVTRCLTKASEVVLKHTSERSSGKDFMQNLDIAISGAQFFFCGHQRYHEFAAEALCQLCAEPGHLLA